MPRSDWDGDKNAKDHGYFIKACIDRDVARVKAYLDRGYNPDDRRGRDNKAVFKTHISTAANWGSEEITRMLITALKEEYRDKPDKYREALASTRAALNPINRYTNKLLFKDEWKDTMHCLEIVDKELQDSIDTLPVNERRQWQAKYPPLDGQRYR